MKLKLTPFERENLRLATSMMPGRTMETIERLIEFREAIAVSQEERDSEEEKEFDFQTKTWKIVVAGVNQVDGWNITDPDTAKKLLTLKRKLDSLDVNS